MGCHYSQRINTLTICDAEGRIIQFSDKMAESNDKYKLKKEDPQSQRKMLRFCRNDIKLQLKFNEEQRIGGRESLEVRRLRKSKVLAFNFATK